MSLARLVWQFGEPVHAVTYFAPETRDRTDRLGLKGGWMSYFGCRAAPLGPVVPEVVCALFYNFHPRMVARAIPDAWAFASPQQLLDARLEAIDEILRRLLGDAVVSRDVRRAADLARAAIDHCDYAGRPLGAANAALNPPSVAHLSLWQSLTTIREHRGDGHVAALLEAGIAPCEALVLQAATGRSDTGALRKNRGWNEEEWTANVRALEERGWIHISGTVTDAGRVARDQLEETTNRLAAPILAGIGIEEARELVGLLRPLAEVVMASGTVSPLNNMGLPWPPIES
jgi:DNA-binding MarR family transcriptional regulator